MTIRLAPARKAAPIFFSPVQQRRLVQRAANDNAVAPRRDPVLREALLHFARFGLGAATVARDKAHDAFFAGDRAGYDHWLAICRALDQRMAAAVAAHAKSPAR